MSKVKFCETHPRNLKDFGDVNAEKIVLTQAGPLRGSVPYLLQSMRVMMRNSFLTKYMQGAHMPHDVDRYMEGSSNNGHDHSYHHSQTKVLEKKV